MSEESFSAPLMFDHLIVSSRRRPSRRTAKFFWATAAAYAAALGAALVASVLIAAPQLADPGDTDLVKLILPPRLGPPAPHRPAGSPAASSAPGRDLTNVATLEDLLSRPTNVAPPALPSTTLIDAGPGVGGDPGSPEGVPHGAGAVPGLPLSDRHSAPPPPPPADPPAARPEPQAARGPLRLTSTVLQGKAIERCKPDYPPLARQIRLQGAVAVELLVSSEGRVESAQALSGHPLLRDAAVRAAACWRFQPTLLNGKPVRVSAVITFVFKLN